MHGYLSVYEDHRPISIFDGSPRMLGGLVDFALSIPCLVPPRLLFVS